MNSKMLSQVRYSNGAVVRAVYLPALQAHRHLSLVVGRVYNVTVRPNGNCTVEGLSVKQKDFQVV